MDAYVFQGELLCPNCAEAVKQRLGSTEAYLTLDSQTYPQGPYAGGGGGADTPQHCGSCREFLENPLTESGIEFVKEALKNDTGSPLTLQQWRSFYKISEEEEPESSLCEIEGQVFFDNTKAEPEGWSIFSTSGSPDPFQLQRIDDAGVFDGDGDAWVFVVKKASENSAYHKAALEYLKDHSPDEYARITKHHPYPAENEERSNESTDDTPDQTGHSG